MVAGAARFLARQTEQEIGERIARAAEPFQPRPLLVAEIEIAARIGRVVDHVELDPADLAPDLEEVPPFVEGELVNKLVDVVIAAALAAVVNGGEASDPDDRGARAGKRQPANAQLFDQIDAVNDPLRAALRPFALVAEAEFIDRRGAEGLRVARADRLLAIEAQTLIARKAARREVVRVVETIARIEDVVFREALVSPDHELVGGMARAPRIERVLPLIAGATVARACGRQVPPRLVLHYCAPARVKVPDQRSAIG